MYVEEKDGIPFEVWLWGKMAGEALCIARSMFDEEYYRSQIAKMIAFEEYNDHLLERYMYWLNDEELESVFEGILTFKRNFDAFISDKNFFAMMEELEDNAVQDCIECGCCLYSCPANIPLLDIIRISKGDVIKIIRGRGQR